MSTLTPTPPEVRDRGAVREPPPAPPPVARPPVGRPPTRRPLLYIIVAVVAILAVVGAVLGVVLTRGGGETTTTTKPAPVKPVSGLGTVVFMGPGGAQWSFTDAFAGPDGTLYFSAKGATNTIAKLSPSGQLTTLTVPGTDLGPVTASPDGTVFTSVVSDNATYIVRMAPGSTTPDLFQVPMVDLKAAGQRTVFPIQAMVVGPDGSLWFERGQVNRWDSFGGYTAAIGQLTPGGQMSIFPVGDKLYYPGSMAFDKSGNLWFSATCVCARNGFLEVMPQKPALDKATGQVVPAGKYTVATKASGATGIGPHPSRFVMVGDNLWFVEQQDDYATEMTPAGDISGTGAVGMISTTSPSNASIVEYALPTRHSRPTGIALGGDGNLWITESGVNKVARMSTSGQLLGQYSVAGAPDDIVAGKDGNLYFTGGGAVDWTIHSHTTGLIGNQFPSFSPYPGAIDKLLSK